MRIVALIAVSMAMVAGAFALGRGTRADAVGPAPKAAAATPEPLEPGVPVSASGIAPAQMLPALRPAPRKPNKKAPRPSQTTTSTSSAPPAATSAPATTAPSTPSAPATGSKPARKPSRPVEEIG